MKHADVAHRIETETMTFKTAIKAAMDESSARRMTLLDHLLNLPVFTDSGEMTETDFYELVADCNVISGNLNAALVPLGFTATSGSAWLSSNNAPSAKYRRDIARLIVDQTVHFYSHEVAIHELNEFMKAAQSRPTTQPVVSTPRPQLLATNLYDCKEFRSVPTGARDALLGEDINNLGELISYSRDELLRVPRIGKVSVAALESMLSTYSLQLGFLSDAEREEVRLRRILNLYAEKPVIATWDGEVKPEFANHSYYNLRRAKDDGKEVYETVSVDPELINELGKVGITYCTELATAPLELLQDICAYNDDWKIEHLTALLGSGRKDLPNYYRERSGFDLTLGMMPPPHLNSNVQVYKER